MNKKFSEWLNKFWDEKEIENRVFSIEHEGELHIIEADTIKDLILNTTENEQRSIKDIFVKIDFMNGNVYDFIEHLAKGYIVNCV